MAQLILITVLMNTLERQHEFGVLLALGTSPGLIFKTIVIEMTLLGLFSYTCWGVACLRTELVLFRKRDRNGTSHGIWRYAL